MIKLWYDAAWDDYLYWQKHDKSMLKKINTLVKDIERNGYKGIGKPEPLKHNLSGWWSVRIDDVNRLVFQITGESGEHLEIYACKGHYED
jgi:toxin YoeB